MDLNSVVDLGQTLSNSRTTAKGKQVVEVAQLLDLVKGDDLNFSEKDAIDLAQDFKLDTKDGSLKVRPTDLIDLSSL
jgi:hypothetical protein